MFRFRGIDARIHLATLIFIGIEILSSLPRDNMGAIHTTGLMACLFVIVLLHEFGHCFACRWTGGHADRIVMLPFGGLAFTMPPHDWKSHLITTVGGPAVNVALLVLSSVALAATGYTESILVNPFNAGVSMPTQAPSNAALIAVTLLWEFHLVNIIILGFNVLLPFFPLDGGRIVQELLWARMGYRRSMEIATIVGIAGAIGVDAFGLATEQMLLVIIAAFGAWACYTERQRLRFMDDPAMAATGLGPSMGTVAPARPSRAQVRARERAEQDAAELDRILDKIRDQGMQSLTRGEKRTLERLRKKKSSTGAPGADGP